MTQFRSLRALSALTLSLSLILALQVTAAQRTHSGSLPKAIDSPYIFGTPLEPSAPVDMNWFSDAAFVGGPQTGALMGYPSLQNSLWLTRVDLDVVSALTASFDVNGESLTLTQALKQKRPAKIYLMIGIPGDVGSTEEGFIQAYRNLIDLIRKTLPEAQIYLQTFPPVTQDWGATYGMDNAVVGWRNARLYQVAQQGQVYLLDVYAALVDKGSLPDYLSSDGLFLNNEGQFIWVQYLRTHTMRT